MITNPRLICLVEDDPLIIRLYERLFSLNNYQLKLAKDGEEAITMLSGLTEELPALVLLDIMMPKLSGYDVLKFMKEHEVLQNIPVIMLSNLASKDDQSRALSMGATMYLVKSQHTPKELLAKIEEFLSTRTA